MRRFKTKQGIGKRSGFRTILFLREGDRVLFQLGYAKNELDNIDNKSLARYKDLAKDFFAMSTDAIEVALRDGAMTEF